VSKFLRDLIEREIGDDTRSGARGLIASRKA
jgi:hypothetical protein